MAEAENVELRQLLQKERARSKALEKQNELLKKEITMANDLGDSYADEDTADVSANMDHLREHCSALTGKLQRSEKQLSAQEAELKRLSSMLQNHTSLIERSLTRYHQCKNNMTSYKSILKTFAVQTFVKDFTWKKKWNLVFKNIAEINLNLHKERSQIMKSSCLQVDSSKLARDQNKKLEQLYKANSSQIADTLDREIALLKEVTNDIIKLMRESKALSDNMADRSIQLKREVMTSQKAKAQALEEVKTLKTLLKRRNEEIFTLETVKLRLEKALSRRSLTTMEDRKLRSKTSNSLINSRIANLEHLRSDPALRPMPVSHSLQHGRLAVDAHMSQKYPLRPCDRGDSKLMAVRMKAERKIPSMSPKVTKQQKRPKSSSGRHTLGKSRSMTTQNIREEPGEFTTFDPNAKDGGRTFFPFRGGSPPKLTTPVAVS